MRTSIKESSCPWCGRHHDLATHVDGDAVPKPGDISVCFGCGEPSVWTADELRIPTDLELASIMANPAATSAMALIKQRRR